MKKINYILAKGKELASRETGKPVGHISPELQQNMEKLINQSLKEGKDDNALINLAKTFFKILCASVVVTACYCIW